MYEFEARKLHVFAFYQERSLQNDCYIKKKKKKISLLVI